MGTQKKIDTQVFLKKCVQYTGLGVAGFAERYVLKLRTLQNWMFYGDAHREPPEFILYAIKRLMEIDYGFKEEYLYLDDDEWKQLLITNNIYYLDKRYQKWEDNENRKKYLK